MTFPKFIQALQEWEDRQAENKKGTDLAREIYKKYSPKKKRKKKIAYDPSDQVG